MALDVTNGAIVEQIADLAEPGEVLSEAALRERLDKLPLANCAHVERSIWRGQDTMSATVAIDPKTKRGYAETYVYGTEESRDSKDFAMPRGATAREIALKWIASVNSEDAGEDVG